ncbi:hypothetical protein L226DRAFT_530050 [Lentinus tigrinus ALCF2SS1-7]|uniref:SRR1-like domain-containing protein n=1 Tax=Lentinus tigrinus ALCF2SS1-6 TaxID=1328759 RepID=A0A5C2SQ02_9APHY|nr:hypothetical protein L227DRAFT_569860 [Lentinus tigrinus ALCF2SS1-6]RPD79860.1 hypothetical protein L226DRAFT_530050 [Lentinus tigrinus ALCF2SS1-7]
MQTLRESLEEAFPPADAAPDVLCLGLGSPSSSRDARAQLALLLAACDDLRIDHTKVSVFDPVFAEQDLQLLAQHGLIPFPENRMARHVLKSPTIAFMPHCDLHLYENLLRENWSKAQLPNVLLIANRLSEYAESIPARKLAAEHPCVARLAPYLTSRPLRPCAPYPTAFNNTAVQFVRTSALAERDSEWWSLPARSPVLTAPASSGLVGTPRDPTPPPRPRSPSANLPVGRPDNEISGTNVNVDATNADADADANANADGDARVLEPDATPSNVRVPATSDRGDVTQEPTAAS